MLTYEHETQGGHHHGPKKAVRDLLQSAARLAGAGHSLHFGCQSSKLIPAARASELIRLLEELEVGIPGYPPSFIGGEHTVFIPDQSETVIKHTLPGFYGRIMDEAKLLDARTFQNKTRLMMRAALPSEYLRRWAVMDDVFGMTTHYLGKVTGSDRDPQMAVEQPFIPEDENLPATLEDAEAFFNAHGFERVADAHIINPEVHGVTWYRQRDGILITDAHARNFRRDLDGVLIPVDLVIALVPPGASALLPAAEKLWEPAEED
jgi:hypothetical protein